MQHRFADPELLIERNRRLVAVIGLNVDHPGAAPSGDLAQTRDQGCRDALPPVLRADGQIIDVYLAPRSLEFVEFVSHEPAENLLARQRHEDDDMLFGEQTF